MMRSLPIILLSRAFAVENTDTIDPIKSNEKAFADNQSWLMYPVSLAATTVLWRAILLKSPRHY